MLSLNNEQFAGMKLKFSPREDEILTQIITDNKYQSWAIITDLFNRKCVELLETTHFTRNSRQCRDRWNNFLAPGINRGVWTPEEDSILLEKYNEYGGRWAVIARFLNGRKDNAVKNRFKLLQRQAHSNGPKKATSEPKKTLSNEEDKPAPKNPPKNFETNYDEFGFLLDSLCGADGNYMLPFF